MASSTIAEVGISSTIETAQRHQGKTLQEAIGIAADRMENDLHQDPDAQATVTDFLDFAEYLPSDMFRSLTLIGNLDQNYVEASKNVHELTKAYGSLSTPPSPPPPPPPPPPPYLSSSRPDAIELRAMALRVDVSQNLGETVMARKLSYEEACRLKDNVDRHFNRLKHIHAKLKKMTENYPISRAASPELSKSPNAARTVPRVTLRLDGTRNGERVRKHRTPRITVPGEVMAPFEVDYDSYGSMSDTDPSGDEGRKSRTQTPGATKPKSIKLNLKTPKDKLQKGSRMVKSDGSGTNVHSQVAGISTSNALAKLKPPPADVKPGDPDAPWLKLTAWELAKLRKKMKKNAVWSPSDTMILRELQTKGRAIADLKRHNEELAAQGLPPLDIIPQMMNAAAAKKVIGDGEISAEAWTTGELSDRAMKSNEAGKLKKEIENKAAENGVEDPNTSEATTSHVNTSVRDATTMESSNSSKDVPMKDVPLVELGVEDTPMKDAPPKVVSDKTTSGKPRSHKKGAAKDAKEAHEAKDVKEVKNSVKEEPPTKPLTEHTHLLSSLEGIKERILATTSSLPNSNEKNAEIPSTTPNKQPAKTNANRKRKTRDSTSDTETSKASKASKIEGAIPGSSLRVERRSEADTPVPTPPHRSSSTATTTTVIPLALPGTTASRSSIRRGTPAPVAAMEALPVGSPDQTSTHVENKSALHGGNDTADLSEHDTPDDVAPAPAAVPPLKQEPEVEKEMPKEPAKKKETQKERRARERKEREAKKAAAAAATAAATAAAAAVPVSAPAPAPRNPRKVDPAPEAPTPDVPALPPRRLASRPSSRNGKASSHEPAPATKDRLRRSSTVHNTPAPEPRGPSKRLEAKRPPPGQVTAGPEGSASVSVSKRKAAPRKRAAAKKQSKSEEDKEFPIEDMVELDDEGNIIDASEPRYCKCNKVSFGNMIACDSVKKLGRDCPYGEWFHYECAGFSDLNMPSRRDSWYCEDCTREIYEVKVKNEKVGNKRK